MRRKLAIDDTSYDKPFSSKSVSANCSLFVNSESESVPILDIVGEVDLSSAPWMFSQIWQSSQKGSRSLILNLEKLDFMDSSGLQVLLRLREKLKNKNQDITLVSPQPQIKKLLRLTGFDKLFSLHESNEEAKTWFQPTDILGQQDTNIV